MAQVFFGRLLADRRKARNLTQEDVASVLGITRANYSQMETGKRKEVLDPERAAKVARLLEIELLDLVIAMGYPIRPSGPFSPRTARVAQAFEGASPAVQEHIARGLGVDN